MSNSWGGARPGAGRKRGRARTRAHLFTRGMKTKEWLQLVQHLKEVALSSSPASLRAASLLMRYQFGDGIEPVERILDRERSNDEIEAESHKLMEQSAEKRKTAWIEDYVLKDLSKPGVEKIFWESSQGRLCISRAEPRSALEKNQEHSSPDLPGDSQQSAK